MIYTFDLSTKIILITGGYGYIGKSIAQSLLAHGALVYILGKDEKKFEDSFREELSEKAKLNFQYCDVSDSISIANAFKIIYSQHNKVDVLINNAFYIKGQSPEEMTDAEWAIGIDGSLNSVFKCIREIIPFFKQVNAGKIINVSSMYGVVAPDFDLYKDAPNYLNPPHYGAAKAGIVQLTKYYASYLGHIGITVNSVAPGPFPSMEVQKNQGFIKNLSDRTCLKRIGKPEDLGGIFIYLASDASNFMTGQNLIIDGGWTIK